MSVRLEEVFKASGVPTYTFVPPSDFDRVRVAIRTAGRGLVIEGPSGIGKSTAVARALIENGQQDLVEKFSARSPSDLEVIELILAMGTDFGVVIIDDFHRLPEPMRAGLADLLKRLADTEEEGSKLVLIGINQAGDSLIQHAPDLSNRIDTIRLETEPAKQIHQLIRQGEEALSITLVDADKIVDAAHGSFYIGQLLCREVCLRAGVLEATDDKVEVHPSFTAVSRSVLEQQEARFGEAIRSFARGTKFRPSGRAPYLHVLSWLRDANEWSISLGDEMARHPEQRTSVSQVVEKGYLASLVESDAVGSLFHFDPNTRVLSIEDPHMAYYLRNIDWPRFVQDVGFTAFEVSAQYDVALSFAGEDRAFAERLYDSLCDEQLAVFYDQAESAKILAQNVEGFLGPIYESEAEFVVAVLGERYGEKQWTLFESDRFKPRIEKGEVVPIWSTKLPKSAFDVTREIGGIQFDPEGDLDMQAKECGVAVAAMIAERRQR